jgi:hypothetical protein
MGIPRSNLKLRFRPPLELVPPLWRIIRGMTGVALRTFNIVGKLKQGDGGSGALFMEGQEKMVGVSRNML